MKSATDWAYFDIQAIVELESPLVGAESNATANLASVDRSAFSPVSLSDLIGDPELSDIDIWEVSRLINAFTTWRAQPDWTRTGVLRLLDLPSVPRYLGAEPIGVVDPASMDRSRENRSQKR